MSEYRVSPTEIKKERKEKSRFLTVSGSVCSRPFLTLSGRQILLNMDSGWVWSVQSQECKVEFFVPQATNSIWRRETRTMATSMRSLSMGVGKSVREWFFDRRGRGFDDCVHRHRSIAKSVQKRSRLK